MLGASWDVSFSVQAAPVAPGPPATPTPEPTAAPAAAGDRLATTGGTPNDLVGVALLLIALGFVALGLHRRRALSRG